MKKLFSFLIIISLVLPVTGGVMTEADDAGCGGCGCAAMTCCPADADGSGKGAPASVPANQLRVSAPDLGSLPVDFFLCALDETVAELTPADRLYRLPKLHVSSLLRNCTFLI